VRFNTKFNQSPLLNSVKLPSMGMLLNPSPPNKSLISMPNSNNQSINFESNAKLGDINGKNGLFNSSAKKYFKDNNSNPNAKS
jgi:hypothetical protein